MYVVEFSTVYLIHTERLSVDDVEEISECRLSQEKTMKCQKKLI